MHLLETEEVFKGRTLKDMVEEHLDKIQKSANGIGIEPKLLGDKDLRDSEVIEDDDVDKWCKNRIEKRRREYQKLGMYPYAFVFRLFSAISSFWIDRIIELQKRAVSFRRF